MFLYRLLLAYIQRPRNMEEVEAVAERGSKPECIKYNMSTAKTTSKTTSFCGNCNLIFKIQSETKETI